VPFLTARRRSFLRAPVHGDHLFRLMVTTVSNRW
jgi:hypothetical protein